VTGVNNRSRRFGSRSTGWLAAALACLLAFTLLACGGSSAPRATNLPPPSEKTVIGPGDIFTMQIVTEKDLPAEYQVASDGTVDLPYIQTVLVAGYEPQEIARIIRQKLIEKKVLVDPIVVVQVKEYKSRTVILLGQIAKPGSFPLAPGITLMQVISLAGGLTQIADDNNVTLTRKYDKGTKTVTISVDAITDGNAPDVPLQAGDRIYVPSRLF
jgi:protein involved in polysaccharide export with SLBB domain